MKPLRLTAVTLIVVATATPSFSAGLPETGENNYFLLVAASFERQNMSAPIAISPSVISPSDREELVRASFERAGLPVSIAVTAGH